MAWYYGTYSCGHEGRVNIVGPMKHREWKAERAFVNPCDECKEKQLIAEREEKTRIAAEKAKELELPELKGTEKQVAWALRIRQTVIEEYEKLTDYPHFERRYRMTLEHAAAAFDLLLQKTSAAWWIENRAELAFLDDYLRKTKLPASVQEQKVENNIKKEIDAESVVRPEKAKTETVAEIRVDGDVVRIHFPERRDDFRELVKSKLSMSWNGECWERKLIYRNGTAEDRAAEAGHRLLAAGFVVRIRDESIREKAVSGQYEPECTRWVVTFGEGDHVGKFGILWNRAKEDFYDVARRLPGNRWSKPYVIVPAEHFEEVQDFAERYGFKISAAAQKLIDAAREAKDRALVMKVAASDEPERVVASTKPPVLEVPKEVEIDEELRDDD